MFTVYVIVSESIGKTYVGQTVDLETRLKQHNALDETHLGRFMKQNRGPWKLAYKEEYQTRQEALKREKQLKSYRAGNLLKI